MTDAAPYQFTTDWFDIYARRIWPDLLARLQPARVLEILEALHAFSGDPRYRPSPWLKRRALLGVSLLHPEH